jgi:hypothetical protein
MIKPQRVRLLGLFFWRVAPSEESRAISNIAVARRFHATSNRRFHATSDEKDVLLRRASNDA